MRVAFIVVAFVIVALVVFAPLAAIAVAVLGAIALVVFRGPRFSGRVVGAAWVAGGALVAVGCLRLLWSHGLAGPWLWAVIAGSLVIALAFLVLPLALRGRGAWLVALGMLLVVLGWATIWVVIGLVLLPVGIALYVGGAVRAGVLPWWAAAGTVAVCLVAPVAYSFLSDDLVLPELAALAAVLTGTGFYVRDSAASR